MAPALLLIASAAGIAALAFGWALWIVWALSAAYLLVLTAGAAVSRLAGRRTVVANAEGDAAIPRKIGLVIPAHNEELLLGGVIDRLHQLDYPTESYCIYVIADNCTDSTALTAKTHGAKVLERFDSDRRGKGFALDWALRQLLADTDCDAFLILDADSYLSTNFLRVMNARLAAGWGAIQGLYQVENVDESWRTRLMACALALAHYVKPLGRTTFGLSDGLKGNGMCFSRQVLEAIPWSGESITEDIEYTLRLVQAGVRIAFTPDAVVLAQMPATAKQSTTQRQRWEGGRYALMGRSAGLLWRSVKSGRPVVADRAIELLIPPFAELFALPAVCFLGGLIWMSLAPASFAAFLWISAWGAVLAAGTLYLCAGLIIARVPLRVWSALLFAPIYIVWKLGVYGMMMLRRGSSGWVRTERH